MAMRVLSIMFLALGLAGCTAPAPELDASYGSNPTAAPAPQILPLAPLLAAPEPVLTPEDEPRLQARAEAARARGAALARAGGADFAQ